MTLKNTEIALIRDAAVMFEDSNLQMAHDLMAIAYKARPEGPLIKKKINIYKEELERPDQDARKKLKELVISGDIAIIPIGFRCYTNKFIVDKLGTRTQESLPFDSGFFSPHAVASVLQTPHIYMSIDGVDENHSVCIKTENYKNINYGLGIKFESSTYKHVNSIATSKNIPKINQYLDSTFGYYTLNIKHQFVLAHYNWHPLSSNDKSKGIVDPKENLKTINLIMKRRISRMMDKINKSKHVIFVFGESQKYQYLQIDQTYYNLSDFDKLKTVCTEKFGDKFTIVNNIRDGSFTAKDAIACLYGK